jgi:cell division protein FtsI/penicillin-binding protein 2
LLRTSIAALVALTGLAGSLTACTGPAHVPPQRVAAQRFLDAVGSGDVPAAARATDDPSHAEPALRASLDGLGTHARAELRVHDVSTTGTRADVHFSATWTLPGVSSRWAYGGALSLHERDGHWMVVWRDDVLHPGLLPDTHLAVRRLQPERAALEDRNGTPLFTETPVVRVGVEKRLVKNLDALAATLARVPELQSSAAEIVAAVRPAGPRDFVSLVTLRRAVYERIKDRIYNLDGTVFQTDTMLLPPSPHFAQPLLGTVGAASDALVRASGGRVRPGDQTGLGGLQQAFDKRLAGTPGTAIYRATDTGTGLDARLATIVAPRRGSPVRLTIDRPMQTAAEAALASITQPASIVAVQPSTGRILADANTAAATYDLGLAGGFPAGSTFKIVTYTAAFTAKPHLTPATKVACPATTTVDGRRFENEDRFAYPPVPISAAFGYSCNTSAIAQAMALPADAVRDAATTLGLGATWRLPVDAFSGSVPAPASQTERAATAIGQGRVQVSPLLMALIAGAADTGSTVVPSLTTGTGGRRHEVLSRALTAKMRTLMTSTVALPNGTAHDLADLGNVRGKTGTAEYGTATPPRSHSWFAGTRGDLAFAVFVYDGDSAHVDAVPITHAFLSRVN